MTSSCEKVELLSRLPPDLTWDTMIQTHGTSTAESLHVHIQMDIHTHVQTRRHTAIRPSFWRFWDGALCMQYRGGVGGVGGGVACGTSLAQTSFPLLP